MIKDLRRLFILALLLSAPLAGRAQFSAHFISVGQGEAIYLELPSGGNALIDGGPWVSSATMFLRQKGVTKLDHVVLTHPHSDHYNGLKEVFSAMSVSNFYDTRLDNANAIGDNTTRDAAAAEPGCSLHYPAAGDTLNWDPQVEIRVLNSCPAVSSTTKSDKINNCSIVLQTRYKGNSALFMGDAGFPVEDAILARPSGNLRSAVLKVGHHGSRHSSSQKFLAAVGPSYAYISAGLNNDYGHPHREVLDRLNAQGAKIFVTTEGTQSFTLPAPGPDGSVQPPILHNPVPMPVIEKSIYSGGMPVPGRPDAPAQVYPPDGYDDSDLPGSGVE